MATMGNTDVSTPKSPIPFPMMSDIEMYRFLLADEPFWRIAKILEKQNTGPMGTPPKTDAEAAQIINAVHQGGASKSPEYWAAINRDSYEIKVQAAAKSEKAKVLIQKSADNDAENTFGASENAQQRSYTPMQLDASDEIGLEEEQAACQLLMIASGFSPSRKDIQPKGLRRTGSGVKKSTRNPKKPDFTRSELAVTRKHLAPKKAKQDDKDKKPDLAVIEEVVGQFLEDEYAEPRWDDLSDDEVSCVVDKMSSLLYKAIGRRSFNNRWELERVVYEEHEFLMEAFGGDMPEHLTRWGK